jgi:hypothetical protein
VVVIAAAQKVTFAATQTMSMPLGQIAPPSAVTALGLRITCYIKIVGYVTLKRQ